MQNALYSGFVIHNRVLPVKHKFSYQLRMFFLDIDAVADIFKNIPIISVNKFNLLGFHRKNYLPSDQNTTIRQEVEKHLKNHGIDRMPFKIFLLAHLSYLGYCYNPVSFYYCYDNDMQLIYLLAEVNNTPWNERFVYVQKIPAGNKQIVKLKKEFHVSPFLPMDMQYTWNLNNPDDVVKVAMTCIRQEPFFYASMKLYKRELNVWNCLCAFVLNPIATQLVLVRIYWQALFLFFKKAPFYKYQQRGHSE